MLKYFSLNRVLFVWCLLLFSQGCHSDWGQPLPGSMEEDIALGQSQQSIIQGKVDITHPAVGAIVLARSPTRGRCSATLITSQLVLTAAHCISSMLRTSLADQRFRIDVPQKPAKPGDKNYRMELFKVRQIVRHPRYARAPSADYDLGLIVLQKKVPTTIATPIPINTKAMDPKLVGEKVRVVGYGYIQRRPRSVYPQDKHAADIPIFQVKANSFIHYDEKTPVDKRVSACHGDSGGPALLKVDGNLRVAGVTSVAYQASMAPDRQTYCDGGAESTRPDTNMDFLRPYLNLYSDKPLACTEEKDCAPCGTCKNKLCAPVAITAEKTSCGICRTDADCGKGICYRFSYGHRCVQPCTEKGCCPTGSYCSKYSVLGQKEVSLCLPDGDTCADISCTADKDCGPSEKCTQGKCTFVKPTANANLCKPCYSSEQCGKGNHCMDAGSSIGYCVQGCADGGYCPDGFDCKQVGIGIRQCVPRQNCFVACKADGDCPAGFGCKDSRCVRKDGGIDGDFCDGKAPCKKGTHRCVPQGVGLSRCSQTCDPPPGSPGMYCKTDLECTKGTSCVSFYGRRVCAPGCKGQNQGSVCTVGGRCYNLRSGPVCICQRDSECPLGNFCNRASGIGFCAPSKTAPCRNGLSCGPISGIGNVCLPAKGTRKEGSTCSSYERCESGTVCTRFTSNAASSCHRPCRSATDCNEGKCVPLGRWGSYCFCSNDSQCSNGRVCEKLFTYGLFSYGLCRVVKKTQCKNDSDCPSEHACKSGKCEYDPAKKNKPFFEQPTKEKKEEKAAEPVQEKAEEAPAEEKGTPDAGAPEPAKEEAPKKDTAGETPETPKKDSVTSIEPQGCSCQTSQRLPTDTGLAIFLLVFWFAWMRRRSIQL